MNEIKTQLMMTYKKNLHFHYMKKEKLIFNGIKLSQYFLGTVFKII